jgi:hypothetical protein
MGGKLKPVEQPRPEPAKYKMCASGCAFRAECYVPVGDGSATMCWLCAHHVVEHGCAVSSARVAECECPPQDVYPHRAHEAPPEREVVEPESPRAVERDRLLSGPPKNLIAWAREAHKQMSKAQHEAIKRRLN